MSHQSHHESTSIFTSESVTEGHPDKVADFISDSVLDAHFEHDPNARVACETLCKSGMVILAGEITSNATVDYEKLVRAAIREIGYVDPHDQFTADRVTIQNLLTEQCPEIYQGVDRNSATKTAEEIGQQGAGDQGIMFGYASDETPELMPLPILLAHNLARQLAADRHAEHVAWLRPDGKTQVSIEYQGGEPKRVTAILVSTQHDERVSQEEIRRYVERDLVPRVLGNWYREGVPVLVNPTGSFAKGGPEVDCGLTGRKIIVDTYGGMARHGGGAFSGKDPSKVDRSGAYYGRFVARQIVREGLARRAEVQVAYAIGRAEPMSVRVDTFGTGDPDKAAAFVRERFDFRPGAIIERLDLLRPLYRRTTNYGHFGKPGLPWES